MSEALTRHCPFCASKPGQACRTRTGRECAGPHMQRITGSQPEPELRQALCCKCGQIRTFSDNYYFRRNSDPNYSYGYLGGAASRRGWRKTATLKCRECGRGTCHALLLAVGVADWEEQAQQFILGGEPQWHWTEEYRDRLRADYFAQFPRNPNLRHRYWVAEAREAWAAQTYRVTALCGEPMELHVDPDACRSTPSDGKQLEPDEIDWDTEFEDTDTGMWWVDMECVDCLAVANRNRLEDMRERVRRRLAAAVLAVGRLNAATLETLEEHLAKITGARRG